MLICSGLFITFASNAKRFAITCVVYYSVPFYRRGFRNRPAKVSANILLSLLMKPVTRIRYSSLDTLTNVLDTLLLIMKFRVCEHEMSFALKINSKSGSPFSEYESHD